MSDDEGASLKLFPRDDEAFAAVARSLFARLGGDAFARAGELERRLQDRYPRVRVVVQDRLGMNGRPKPYWYVYRDGRLMGEARSRLR